MEEASDNSLVNLDPAPAKPGMVARLMEIKKRRKQIANGKLCFPACFSVYRSGKNSFITFENKKTCNISVL